MPFRYHNLAKTQRHIQTKQNYNIKQTIKMVKYEVGSIEPISKACSKFRLKNHRKKTAFFISLLFLILSFTIYYHVSGKSIKFVTIEEKQKMFNLNASTRSSPLFENGIYDNPWPTWQKFSLFAVLRWKLGFLPKDEKEFNQYLSSEFKTLNLRPENYLSYKNSKFDVEKLKSPISGSQIKITWLGHASMFIQFSNGLNFITDPVFVDKLSGIDFTHLRTSKIPCHISDLYANNITIDAVLISHDHQDHTNLPTLHQLQKFYPDVPYIVPVGMSNKTDLKKFLSENKVFEMTWWQSESFIFSDKEVKITGVPTQHWSIRHWYKGRNEALWNGYVIQVEGKTVYFVGDSGYFQGFREIKNEFPNIDVALIPIGSYLPRWFTLPQHISPQEAIEVFKDLGARHGFGMHWLTFDQSDDKDGMPAVEFDYFKQKENGTCNAFKIAPIGTTTIYE